MDVDAATVPDEFCEEFCRGEPTPSRRVGVLDRGRAAGLVTSMRNLNFRCREYGILAPGEKADCLLAIDVISPAQVGFSPKRLRCQTCN